MAEQSDEIRTHRITANIDLAVRFLETVIDAPPRLDGIADGSTVIVVPPDDPEQARANLALADRLAGAGRSVTLQHLGGPTSQR